MSSTRHLILMCLSSSHHLSVIWVLLLFVVGKSVSLEGHILLHDDNFRSNVSELCLATLNEANLRTTLPLDESGSVLVFTRGSGLAGRVGVSVACINNTGLVVRRGTLEVEVNPETLLAAPPSSLQECSSIPHSGYYDANSTWHSNCRPSLPCRGQNDGWIFVVGDSVIRQQFMHWVHRSGNLWDIVDTKAKGFKQSSDTLVFAEATRRNGKSVSSLVYQHSPGLESKYLKPRERADPPPTFLVEWTSSIFNATYGTVGRFSNSGHGPFRPNPRDTLPLETRPAAILFTIGYHYEHWTFERVEKVTHQMFSRIREVDTTNITTWVYMTNFAALERVIPEKYRDQKATRTMLREYHKNRIIARQARRFGIHVADFFTPELFGHDRRTHTDAVHLAENSTGFQVMSALLGEMCSN